VCREPFRRGELKIFAFSTVVSELKGHDLSKAPMRNTWGTDINTVLEHATSIPAKRRPKVILIATDGYVEAGVIKEVHLLRNADGSVRTLGYCSDYRKPVLHLAGALFTISEAALFLTAFLRRYRIGRLNVAGPQRSQDLFAGKFARSVLDVTFGFTLGQEQARRGL
jgi:hypothetical protein